jgi:cyclophilin family peptidyl-prolyl cis-trans isomerase
VNLVDNPDLDPLPTRWGYCVFGHVVEGMDVIDRIGVAATGAAGPFKSDAPLTPIIIQKVTLLDSNTPTPSSSSAAPTANPSGNTTILSPK